MREIVMSVREQNHLTRQRRDEELDELLEAFLDAKDQLGRIGKAAGVDALSGTASVLAEGARALARGAERLDPAPWHEKLWRKIKRSVS
jgi:hypothetical protein